MERQSQLYDRMIALLENVFLQSALSLFQKLKTPQNSKRAEFSKKVRCSIAPKTAWRVRRELLLCHVVVFFQRRCFQIVNFKD